MAPRGTQRGGVAAWRRRRQCGAGMHAPARVPLAEHDMCACMPSCVRAFAAVFGAAGMPTTMPRGSRGLRTESRRSRSKYVFAAPCCREIVVQHRTQPGAQSQLKGRVAPPAGWRCLTRCARTPVRLLAPPVCAGDRDLHSHGERSRRGTRRASAARTRVRMQPRSARIDVGSTLCLPAKMMNRCTD